jgi:hypothetical protein
MGGPTPLADGEKSYIQRQDQRIPFSVKALWDSRNPQLDMALEPEDLIVIPMKKMQVVVAGEVNTPAAFPFTNGDRVHNYILAAGGIDPETGSQNSIFFIDERGNRKKVTLDTSVTEPGTLIYVGRNSWTLTTDTLGDILILTGFVVEVIAVANAIINFVLRF